MDGVPVIDISRDPDVVHKEIDEACKKWGFIVVSGLDLTFYELLLSLCISKFLFLPNFIIRCSPDVVPSTSVS